MPNPGTTADPRWCRWLGLVGSTALAAGGLSAGALPVGGRALLLDGHVRFALFLAYFGMVLLIAAWLLLGQTIGGARPPSPAQLVRTLLWWAGPLVLGPPLFSRDVYSYLAQGAMVEAGLDVYTDGPAALGGTPALQVPGVWQHTPAPYGPVFVTLSAWTARITGAGAHFGVFGLRLVALLALALIVVLLPRLARACGADPAAALWLGALNPLVLFHLVAGAHNDAVMVALLVAGLVAALGRRPVRAAVLVTVAALVKAPAALGLVGVAWVWCGQLAGRLRLTRAMLATAVIASATTIAVTAATGTGYGWIRALSTPVSADNWAPTSVLGRTTADLLDHLHTGLAEVAVPAWRSAGLLAAGLCVGALAVLVRRERIGVVHALGLGLAAVVTLGPAIRPWYALWGLILIAAAAPDANAARRWGAGIAALLALAAIPDGFAPDPHQVALAVAGGLLAVATVCYLLLLPSVLRGSAEHPGDALW